MYALYSPRARYPIFFWSIYSALQIPTQRKNLRKGVKSGGTITKEHAAKLQAENVEDALREVQEFDPDRTASDTSEGTSDAIDLVSSDDELVIDLTDSLKLRL